MFTIHIDSLDDKRNLPWQDWPSEASLYPGLQLHMYDPMVFEHSSSQPCVFSIHSFISEHIKHAIHNILTDCYHILLQTCAPTSITGQSIARQTGARVTSHSVNTVLCTTINPFNTFVNICK